MNLRHRSMLVWHNQCKLLQNLFSRVRPFWVTSGKKKKAHLKMRWALRRLECIKEPRNRAHQEEHCSLAVHWWRCQTTAHRDHRSWDLDKLAADSPQPLWESQ